MSDYPWRQGPPAAGPQGPGAQSMGQSWQNAQSQASQVAGQTERQARRLGGRLSQGIDRARVIAAEGLSRAANTLRGSSPDGDTAARRFAENLERSAAYLRQTDMNGIQRDMAETIRRYPLQAVGVALVTGWLLGLRMGRR